MAEFGNVIGIIFLFIIIAIAIYSAINTIATIDSTTIGGCNRNATGSLVNCSYSDHDFNMMNATTTQANQLFTTLSVMQWLIIAAAFMVIAGLFLTLKKK